MLAHLFIVNQVFVRFGEAFCSLFCLEEAWLSHLQLPKLVAVTPPAHLQLVHLSLASDHYVSLSGSCCLRLSEPFFKVRILLVSLFSPRLQRLPGRIELCPCTPETLSWFSTWTRFWFFSCSLANSLIIPNKYPG